MIRNFCILMVFIMAATLCGCDYLAGTSAGRILPPPVSQHSFEGKWEVTDNLGPDSPAGSRLGSFVQFADDAIVFDDLLWDRPSYKIKRVVAEVYLAAKSITGVTPGTSTEKADVVMIYASGKYLGEFMKFDETAMILLIENEQLFLSKVSDKADDMLRETYQEARSTGSESGDALSGVLIGLRSKNWRGDYVYRTIWIAASRNDLRPPREVSNIFFPRMSGFWECFPAIDTDGETFGNILVARNAFAKAAETPAETETPDEAERPAPAQIIINYIGNDYVSVEHTADGVSRLFMLPVDSLSSPEKVKASDLLGVNGFISYENARTYEVLALLDENIDLTFIEDYGESFGLLREKGHWKLVGRINYIRDELYEHSDFELKVIPPANLVFYDTLALNWNKIKDRVPDALDAFTSPDKSIAIVRTKNKLTVYTINAEQLSEDSLGEIEISEGETIVMSEWATAIYVDPWERSFISYGGKSL